MKNMADVEIVHKGKRWFVYRNAEFVGRYGTQEEAQEAAKVAQYADTWPPVSGAEGIRWHSGKWEFRKHGSAYRDVKLVKVLKYRDKLTRTTHHERAEKAEGKERKNSSNGCAKCVWRLALSGSEKGQNRYHCGYSLCWGHHSRVWLHYQRTGKQSLEGMTHGTGCTEFMPGNPRDKLSLLQDDPANVTEKAWALLEREGVITQTKERTPASRKPYALTADMDMEKAGELRKRYEWREIAATAGMSLTGMKSSWERQRINRIAAKRLLDAYEIDITK